MVASSSTLYIFKHDDDSLKSPVTQPLPIGQYPFECIGDTRLCLDGFTLSFWLQVTVTTPSATPQYVISSGGEWASTNGFYVTRRYGNVFNFVVAVNETVWQVNNVTISTIGWSHMTLAWNGVLLKVYIDGYPLPIVDFGTSRLYTSPSFEVFPTIWLGAATEYIFGSLTTSNETLDAPFHIYFIRHENRYISDSEAQQIIGKFQNLISSFKFN